MMAMSNIPVHEAAQSVARMPEPRDGFLTDKKMAAHRDKTERAQRDERRRGVGPPYVKDGRQILYPIAGYRKYLEANMRQPVRSSPPVDVKRIPPARDSRAKKRTRPFKPAKAAAPPPDAEDINWRRAIDDDIPF
jgi:hypothetical protein